MFALAETVMMAVDADMVNLYLVETEGEITRYSPDEQSEPRWNIKLDLQSIWTSPDPTLAIKFSYYNAM